VGMEGGGGRSHLVTSMVRISYLIHTKDIFHCKRKIGIISLTNNSISVHQFHNNIKAV